MKTPDTILRNKNGYLYNITTKWQLYVLVLIPVIYFIIFKAYPIYGYLIAFKDFRPSLGIMGSPWAGLRHFERFFNMHDFWRIFLNTFFISTYTLLLAFPIPIILAISINYLRVSWFKRFAQTVTYAPHFLSTIVVAGLIIQFLHPRMGIVNNIIEMFGGEAVSFMSRPQYFYSIYAWTDVWQHAGWNSIIFLAALSGVNPELHESATLDGASKLKRVIHIDIPCILPTIVIMMIVNMGDVLGVGFEKVFALQNDLNLSKSEIIPTYVYRIGVLSQMPNYSYATAIGLFNSAIALFMIIAANYISRKVSENSLW